MTDLLSARPSVVDGPALVAEGLTHRFGDLVAVDDVSLTVPRGTVYGLLGPDGAGKTTLLRILATVLIASHGDATISEPPSGATPDTSRPVSAT